MKFRVPVSLALLVLSSACAEHGGRHGVAAGESEACPADLDHDGYGEGCELGPDCDDDDRQIHQGCGVCARPQQGCECALGSPAVSCFLPATPGSDGELLCQEGTRYCRDGAWSGCESIHTYPMPDPSGQTSLIDPNA